jgi:hypothetical protein
VRSECPRFLVKRGDILLDSDIGSRLTFVISRHLASNAIVRFWRAIVAIAAHKP